MTTKTKAKPAGRGRTATKTAKNGAPRITAKNLTADEKRFLSKHKAKLSPSTLRAKWIHSADEHEDRPGQTLATCTHEVIQHWAEERDATPATVPGSAEADDRPRVLRFDFPGGGDLESIDWDEWFETFDNRQLVFLFQEHLKNGDTSNFFRLDSPTRERA